jgi:CHAT domain-containing protein/tetratricopeptide (TPR) repeat protein
LTRPLDEHLDNDELDRLLSLQRTSVSDSGRLLEQSLREAERHVESCQDCSQKLQMHKSVHSEILRMRAPNPSPPTPECIGDAEWLDVAAGLYPDEKTRDLMKHAAQCGYCGPLLKNAAEALVDEPTPSEEAWLSSLRSARPEWQKNMAATLRANAGARDGSREKKERVQWWLALLSWPRPAFVLSGIAVAALTGWLGLRMIHPPSAEQLLAQAYTEHRTLEVRISGAKYAPIRVERSTGGSNLDKSPSLLKAESLIGENLRKSPNDPVWLQAKGRADLLVGNYESAIKSLQRALEIKPDDPTLLTDLGSAYFVRAETADRAIDYGNAVESLGKALAKSPDNPVALFNRALACESMFLYTQAVDDWEHYLRVDPQGEWSDDARKRLSALQAKLKRHEQSQAEPLFKPSDIARESTENDAVRAKIAERLEEYLNLAVTDWLPSAYPTARQAATDLSDLRASLPILAEVAIQKHADRWLTDLLASTSSPEFALAVEQLSIALKANDTGNNVLARQHAAAAERLFASARNDAGSLRARIEYLFASHDAQEGNHCLEAANGFESRLNNHSYTWLRAQFHLEQGTCYRLMGNLGESRRLYSRAGSEAEASGYSAIYLRAQDHLSGVLGAVGNLPESWATTQHALARFWSGQYPAMRGYNLYYELYELSRLSKQPYLQISVWCDGLALSESFSDNVLRAMAHSFMGHAAIAVDQPQNAEKEFTRASQLFAASPQIKSTRIDHIEAETRLAEVEANSGRSEQAVLRLQKLEPEVALLSDNFLAILFYTILGEAESRINGGDQAEPALRSAIVLCELYLQSVTDDKSRLEWSQQTSSTYRNYVQLRLHQGDIQGALEIWEWYRGAALRAGQATGSSHRLQSSHIPTGGSSLLQPHEVTSQLPSFVKQTIVSYAVLPEGLAVWVYDNRGIDAYWIGGKSKDIEAKAHRFRSQCSDPISDESDLRQNSHALYDLLVAPIEQYFSPSRTLVIELDEGLDGLPFDALLDAQNRYLNDRWPIVSSLGVYYRPDIRASLPITIDTAALVAAVPTSAAANDIPVSPLPDAVLEGEMVAHNFRSAKLLIGKEATADTVYSLLPGTVVFHFAGHATSSSQRTGLLLHDSLLSASSLKQASLSRLQLAVFSACNTQDGSDHGVYDSDSLVRVFLRLGVPRVVASRWNVNSGATQQFMDLFYRALLSGNSVAQSIQHAQSVLRAQPRSAHPYYWSAFTAFGNA